MSHRNKIDGTEWETQNVAKAVSEGYESERLAEGGSKDVSDVVVHHPKYAGLQELQHAKIALAFKQYDPLKPGQTRRASRKMYVVDFDTFWFLVRKAGLPWFIECKATERLNVGKTLEKAKRKVATALQRRLQGQGQV